MMSGYPDFLRALCLEYDNSAGDADYQMWVELCPGARVYGVELSADNGAALTLQDSSLTLSANDCSLHFDLPGLVLPANTRFVVRTGSTARLTIVYGNCS